MNDKHLGKIQRVQYGHGDAGMGLFFTLGDGTWAVQDSITAMRPSIKLTESSKWTCQSRMEDIFDVQRRIEALMLDAKVLDVMLLLNKPIEATFEGNLLRSWRILTEVL